MHILYLGDKGGMGAEYLKDVFAELEHTVEYVDFELPLASLEQDYDIIVISDYPAKQLGIKETGQIITKITQGSRCLMLGGWNSFNGQGANYYQHPLAQALPVELQEGDDRVNSAQGLVIRPDESLASDLPIDWQNPPVICGYNAVEVANPDKIRMWALPIETDGYSITLLQQQPLVAVGSHDKGIVVACMTDLAPNWSGGLIDWGSERRQLEHVEVGDMYIQFVRLLLEIV